MNRAAWLALALSCAVGCKDKAASESQASKEPEAAGASESLLAPSAEQIEGLIRGLDAVASAEPAMQLGMVAQLMHETIAADDPCFANADTELTGEQAFDLDRILACARPCPIEAAQLASLPPDARIPALRTACKDVDLGVPPGASDLLTPHVLLLARAARLLAHAHKKAPADRADDLGQAMAAVAIDLPAPSWTLNYRLPTAPAAVARPLLARRYATIGSGDPAYHEAAVLRFRDDGIEVAQASAEQPAQAKPVDAGADEPAKGRYTMRSNATSDPQLARKQAIDQAREAGILGVLSAEAQRPSDTMILADAQTPASTVIESAQAMDGALLGVTGGGATAWALLGDDPSSMSRSPQRIRLGSTAIRPTTTLVISRTGVVASGEERESREIPRSGSAVDTAAVRDVIREWRAIPELPEIVHIAVEVSEEVSYRDLVDVLSALAQDAPYVFHLAVTGK